MINQSVFRREFVRVPVILISFGIWPLLAFIAVNLQEGIEPWRATLLTVMVSGFISVFLALMHWVFRNKSGVRVYYLFPVIIVSFYFFTDIMNVLGDFGFTKYRYRILFLVGAFLIVSGLVLKWARSEKFRLVIVSVGVAIFVAGGVSLGHAAIVASQGSVTSTPVEGSGTVSQSEVLRRISMPKFLEEASISKGSRERPNIYYLLPDGHVSPEVLRSEFGLDSSTFLKSLKNLGFRVYDRGWSNYPATRTSVSSTMSMQYLYRPDNLDEKAEIRSIDERIIRGENWVIQALAARGYSYVHIPNGFIARWNCGPYVDHCIKKPEGLLDVSETDVTFLVRTPIPILVQTLFRTFIWAGRITEFTDFAEMLPVDVEPPYFLVFHTMAPHSPYRFTADCESIRVFQDVSDSLYLEQVQCVDKQIVLAAKRIIETDPEAIIVLQSDHGFWTKEQSDTPMLDWTERRKRITMSFLGAYRLPEHCRHLLPEEMTQVNAFRIVLGCIDDNEPPLLDNRSYLPIWVYHPRAKNEVYQWSAESGEIK